MKAVAQTVHMKQWQAQEKAVCARNLPAGQEIQGVCGEVIVCENSAPGDARGSRGVDDGRGRISVEPNPAELGGENGSRTSQLLNRPEGYIGGYRLGRDHGARVCIGEDMGDFPLPIKDIEGDQNHTQLEAGEVDIDHLAAIRQGDAQAVARFETARG